MFNSIIAGLKRIRTWAYVFPIRKKVVYGEGLHVGRRTRIWAPSRIIIGENVYIGKDVSIECNCRIGDYVLVANRVAFVGRLDHDFRRVGVPVRFSPWVGGNHDTEQEAGMDDEVVVESDVWLGYGVIVLTGVNIGRGSVIAAGSVVTRDIPPYSIAAGVPARVIGQRFDDAEISEHEYRIKHGRFEFSERGYDSWVVEPYTGAILEDN